MAAEIDESMVRHIGHLARLKLSEPEVAMFGRQLSDILRYMDKLNELDTTDVEPTAHPLPIRNVFGEDEPHEPLTPERALANAPQREGSFFAVPKVLDQDSGA